MKKRIVAIFIIMCIIISNLYSVVAYSNEIDIENEKILSFLYHMITVVNYQNILVLIYLHQ